MAVAATSHADLFAARAGEIAHAPSGRQVIIDRTFRAACVGAAGLTVLFVTFIVLRIAVSAMPAVEKYGVSFLVGRVWDPNAHTYGILAETWGTLYTAVLALIIGSVFGVAAAIFLSESFLGQATFAVLRMLGIHLHPVWGRLPDQFESLLKNLIELLAAIPSVVYGLWGLFVVIPMIRP